MRHHRAYMDNPKLFRTVAHRPPIARGHRRWLHLGDTRFAGRSGLLRTESKVSALWEPAAIAEEDA